MKEWNKCSKNGSTFNEQHVMWTTSRCPVVLVNVIFKENRAYLLFSTFYWIYLLYINYILPTTLSYPYTHHLFTGYLACCKHAETRINCVRGTWLKQADHMRDYFNVVYQLHYAGFISLLTLLSLTHSLSLIRSLSSFPSSFSLSCTKHTHSRIVPTFFLLPKNSFLTQMKPINFLG